jgi:hypothetical protein
MGAVYDDLPGHEGYAVDHDGLHLAACSCGWRDHGPGSTTDHDAAIERWDRRHASGLLVQAVPREIAELVEDTRRAVAHLARNRPRAAGVVLDQLDGTVSQLRSLAHDFDRTTPTVRQRLQAFRAVRRPPGPER